LTIKNTVYINRYMKNLRCIFVLKHTLIIMVAAAAAAATVDGSGAVVAAKQLEQ